MTMQPFREVECERLTQRNVEVATELDDRSSVLHTNREEKNKILTIGTIASVISLHREVGERTKPFALDDPLRECLDHVIVFDERHLLSRLRR